MPTLYITEFKEMPNNRDIKNFPQAAMLPALTTQAVSFTTSTASAAFGVDTRFVRIQADADCHIKGGTDPTATTSDLPLVAGAPEYFGVTPGQKIAAIQAA